MLSHKTSYKTLRRFICACSKTIKYKCKLARYVRGFFKVSSYLNQTYYTNTMQFKSQ